MTAVVHRELQLRQIRRRMSRFERVASFLLACSILAGVAVAWLGLAWLVHRIAPAASAPTDVELVDVLEGEEEGMAGDSPELGESAIAPSELPMREEGLEYDDSEVVEVLSSVLDALSDEQVDLSDPSQRTGQAGSGRGGEAGGQGREGTGPGAGGVPSYARWDIRYPSQSLDDYAAMLDFFGIELGVVRPGQPVTYVSALSKARPILRQGGGQESRLNFRWQDAPRRQADMDLLRRKGVATEGAILVQFYPAELEQTLLEIETKQANRPVRDIRKTRFGIRPSGAGFEFYVVEQQLMQ